MAKILNVELAGYLKGGLNMVSGHNGVMYLNENYDNELHFSLLIIFLSLALLLVKLYPERTALPKNLVVLFLFSATTYILYKQAFVRADIQHIMEFYKYFLLFVVCLQDFHYDLIGRHSNSVVVAIIFIAFFFSKKREDRLFRFDERLSKTEYFNGLDRFTDTSGFHLFPNNNQVPAAIRSKIGNKQVDIYPWNSRLLLENKLNYQPRPVFQSYLAYTPYLENLNAGFYASPQAPDYVLYEYDAIDSRYPLFDEPKVNLTLLKNYTCTDTFSFAGRPVLVLEKSNPSGITLQKIKEYEICMNALIVPQAGMYYTLFVSNTLAGKLTSVIDHAPELSLVIKLKDGNEREYRTSIALLETGIFSDHFFSSTSDFFAAMKKDSAGLAANIAGYYLRPKHPSQFKAEIKVIAYKIN